MLKIFIGHDHRQPLSYNVLAHSIASRASVPISITPLVLHTLPMKRGGLTPFTWSRFMVPYLCGFDGMAVFMDADMLCLCDIAELLHKCSGDHAVWVSKNKHRFEWASLIVYNCSHPSNEVLDPEYIEKAQALHGMQWLKESEVGAFPGEYNHLVGYDEPRPDAKIIHFTQGMPIFDETEGSEYTAEWRAEHKSMNSIRPWQELMGRSVHAAPTKDGRRLVAKLHKDAAK